MNIKKSIVKIKIKEDLSLDSGKILNDYEIAFKTFGKLNKDKTNAILVCHALTGDQFCTGKTQLPTSQDGGVP